MEIHDLLSSVPTSSASVAVGGGLIAWFIRTQIKRVLDAIEQLPKDMIGLSKKLDSVKIEIEDLLNVETTMIKEKFNDLRIEHGRMDERLKFMEAKK